MNKIFATITLLFAILYSFGQDVIIRKNGEEIESKVLEIELETIKYKRFDNIDGPTITLRKSDVFMIKYENGTKEIIDQKEEKVVPNNPVPEYSDGDKVATITYHAVEYARTEKDREIYTLIKVNPLMILNGDIPIYVEHRIGEKISYEMGLGMTHMDYIYESVEISEDLSLLDRKANFGYSFRASFRFYPSSYTKALDEIYFGPEIRIKRYNTYFESCDGVLLSERVEEHRGIFDFRLTAGYIEYLSDKVILEAYGGIGIRSKNEARGSCVTSGGITSIVDPTEETGIVPLISAGFKIGFGL